MIGDGFAAQPISGEFEPVVADYYRNIQGEGGGGSAKRGLTIYFLHRTKKKNQGQRGRGGSIFGQNSRTSFMDGTI